MRKIIIALAMLCAVCACDNTNNVTEDMYPVDIEKSIDACYDAACQYLNIKYDYKAKDEKKIRIIRRADLQDAGGDVLAEMDAYADIYKIIWPHGYGKE